MHGQVPKLIGPQCSTPILGKSKPEHHKIEQYRVPSAPKFSINPKQFSGHVTHYMTRKKFLKYFSGHVILFCWTKSGQLDCMKYTNLGRFFRSCNALHDFKRIPENNVSVLQLFWCGWYVPGLGSNRLELGARGLVQKQRLSYTIPHCGKTSRIRQVSVRSLRLSSCKRYVKEIRPLRPTMPRWPSFDLFYVS